MNIKDVELWIGLYNSIKEVWFIIFVPVVISIIKLLNKNDLYQSKNSEKLKMIFKNA
ncbi:hypothetical protein [Staphylococcus equorum]|uniref:hypothetical protein n=1 Tax=Staphylococcus equorum TaxID=246432 RepID=UPI003FD8E99D